MTIATNHYRRQFQCLRISCNSNASSCDITFYCKWKFSFPLTLSCCQPNKIVWDSLLAGNKKTIYPNIFRKVIHSHFITSALHHNMLKMRFSFFWETTSIQTVPYSKCIVFYFFIPTTYMHPTNKPPHHNSTYKAMTAFMTLPCSYSYIYFFYS